LSVKKCILELCATTEGDYFILALHNIQFGCAKLAIFHEENEENGSKLVHVSPRNIGFDQLYEIVCIFAAEINFIK
jgi:hypothetical protein